MLKRNEDLVYISYRRSSNNPITLYGGCTWSIFNLHSFDKQWLLQGRYMKVIDSQTFRITEFANCKDEFCERRDKILQANAAAGRELQEL